MTSRTVLSWLGATCALIFMSLQGTSAINILLTILFATKFELVNSIYFKTNNVHVYGHDFITTYFNYIVTHSQEPLAAIKIRSIKRIAE